MKESKLIHFTERIYYMPGEEEVDRPYLYYIKGAHYSVAIDAGNSKAHLEKFYQELQHEELELPQFTIITHWHWDHTFALPYIHGLSIGSELTRKKLEEVSQWSWTPEAMKQREKTGEDIPFCNECIQKEYADLSQIQVKSVDIAIAGDTIVDLGGVQLQLIPRDAVHSRDSLFIYIPKESALIIGDADCEDHYEGKGTFDQKRLCALHRFVKELDFEHYLLGHDTPDTKGSALDYMQEKLDKLTLSDEAGLNPKILLQHLNLLHTTELGAVRIKKNLSVEVEDVVDWCRKKIEDVETKIYREGKNWYIEAGQACITVNAHSYTIITAHKKT